MVVIIIMLEERPDIMQQKLDMKAMLDVLVVVVEKQQGAVGQKLDGAVFGSFEAIKLTTPYKEKGKFKEFSLFFSLRLIFLPLYTFFR